MRTHLGRELTLEETYQRKCRVEIAFESDDWGWPSSVGPMNPVRGYITKNSPTARWRIYLLARRRDSMGGYQIDERSHIQSIREVIE